MSEFYVPAKQSRVKFYQAVPLYIHDKNRNFVLYKPAGDKLDRDRLEQGQYPGKLYLKKADELRGVREIQNTYHVKLKSEFETNNQIEVKKTIINIVEEIFSNPISGSLEGLSATVNILVGECLKEPQLAKKLILIPHNYYDLFLHSVNVMALAVNYSIIEKLSLAEIRLLAISALLHDVGKTKIDSNILDSPNKLDDEEFCDLQSHTTIGYQLIDRCNFANPEVQKTALQHHERADGSGYPNKLKRISKTAQIVGLIDSYESLTQDDRPYRSALESLKALTILKNEVEAGRFNRKLFKKFVYTLM